MAGLLVVLAVLSFVGGAGYAINLWQHPLTEKAGWMALIGGAVGTVYLLALVTVLGNQRQILKELATLKESAGVAESTQEPTGPQ